MDARCVVNDEAIRVAAEGATKKAEYAELVEGAAASWYKAYDGWYEATEEGPKPAAEEEADAIANVNGEEAVHDREMAKLNVSIEEHLAELTRKTREHEDSVRADRRHLGDLIGWKNELIAQEAATRLVQIPSLDRRAHKETAEVELGRQQRQCRQQVNKEAQDVGHVRLEAGDAVERADHIVREEDHDAAGGGTRPHASCEDGQEEGSYGGTLQEGRRRATQLVSWSEILTHTCRPH
jgi:hypothetical protein